MSARPLTARTVGFVVAVAVSLVTAGPAFAQIAARGSCAAMAGADGCAGGSVVSSCCCAAAHPATPPDRQSPGGGTPSFAWTLDGAGWFPVTLSVPSLAQIAPTHGYHSVPLHTLHSTFLI
jgi:hypothetical protein